jgi:hypothetical protein
MLVAAEKCSSVLDLFKRSTGLDIRHDGLFGFCTSACDVVKKAVGNYRGVGLSAVKNTGKGSYAL